MADPTLVAGRGASGVAFTPEPASLAVAPPVRGMVLRRFLQHRLAVAGLVALGLVVAVTLVAGALWRYDHAQITDDLSSPPSWSHPMGTDGLGRDLFAQVLRGTRTSLQVALVVAVVSTAFGAVLGAVAGYCRGWVDGVLMRLTDVVLSVPAIAVLAVLARAAQGTPANWLAMALILSALSWPGMARIVRAMILSLREREFAEAARAAGASGRRILFRHLLPHTSGPVIVRASLRVGGAILAEAALSFLGLGLTPPDTSLGVLVSTGQHAATTRPWLFYFPGLVILLIVLSINFVGDGLRDALDPAPAGRGRALWHVPRHGRGPQPSDRARRRRRHSP